MNEKTINSQRGVALILTIMLMTLVLFLSMYFVNFSLSEKQISVSQSVGQRTYYLAEAGISDMVWKIKNDPAYKGNFESVSDWSTTTVVANPFGADSGTYSVTLTNTSKAHADIVSTGSYNINGKVSQRIIKTKIYKPIGTSAIGSSTSFADGNIDISSSIVNFIDGNAHSDGVFNINGNSNVYVEKDLEAVGNYNKNQQATVNVDGSTHALNFPPAANASMMPAVDFDSNASTSMKNLASTTYSAHQFEDLIDHNSTLTLNGIIYVTDDIEIDKNVDLTINGLLVVNGDIDIGSYNHNYHHNSDHEDHESDHEEYNHHNQHNHHHQHYDDVLNITVNSATGTPSGIMADGKIKFMNDMGNIRINGILYSTDYMTLENILDGQDFAVYGGTASRKLTVTGSSRPINFVYNNQILVDSLGAASSSPVLVVEHWEEEY